MKKYLVVFDLETTGLDKDKDRILQFAGIKVDTKSGDVVEEKNIFIQPEGNFAINIGAYLKHGILPKDVINKSYLKDVAQEIIDFIGDNDVLTYNGNSFDIPFLAKRLRAVGYNITFTNLNCYDAMLEERRRNDLTLEGTYKRYIGKTMDEDGYTAHNALSDVKATYIIFMMQQQLQAYEPDKMYGDDGIIKNMPFKNKICPCFTIGKYRTVSVEFVKNCDPGYLEWITREDSGFMQSTKDYIRSVLEK